MKETDLVRAILIFLQLAHPRGVWFRQNTGAVVSEYKGRKRFIRYGVPGMADIQGVLDGRSIFIEAKVGKNKQPPAQKAFQEAVQTAGGIYILARSIDDVAKALPCVVVPDSILKGTK